jgi:outer membrane protein assembly factor BamB
MRISGWCGAIFCLIASSVVHLNVLDGQDAWPGFRGPTGLGYTPDAHLPLTWGGPEGRTVLWKSPLKGQGHASPIVWGDSVFVCTAWWPPKGEPQAKVMPEHHVTCYRTSDGKLMWDTLVPAGPWLRSDFRSGPGGGYAGPTPATDGKLVYCAFGSSVIAALDFDGKIVWRKEIVPYTFDVTVGGSPVLFRDTVLMFCPSANGNDSRLIAYEKATGDVKWVHPFPGMKFGHSTPTIIDVNGKPQLLVLASGIKVSEDALQSLDPTDGRRIWWCRGGGDAASIAYGSGIVYFDSGRGGPGVAVDPTGTGDVSKTHVKWTIPQVPEGIGSPVIVGKYVYRLHRPGILRCWEVATGKEVYAQRLDGITTTWASPVVDPEGHIFFASAGKSYVIQAGPEFRVVATNDLSDPNHPSPAVAGDRMYLEGMKDLYCIGSRDQHAAR